METTGLSVNGNYVYKYYYGGIFVMHFKIRTRRNKDVMAVLAKRQGKQLRDCAGKH